MTTTIAVIFLKGGSGKTTGAAFIAHAVAQLGVRVLAVDADPQQSLMDWAEQAGWTVPCVSLPSGELHRRLPGIVGDRFDAVVIDTPPHGPLERDQGGEQSGRIVRSAARAATHILIPVAPTPAEYKRLPAMRELLDDVADLRPDGQAPPVVAVLLCRTVASATSTATYRAAMREDGWHVLAPQVARLERFAQADGEPVHNALATAYGDAVLELLEMEVAA